MNLELTFPASASSEASILARELRLELAEGGIPVQSIAIARTDPENMDLGTVLQVGMDAMMTLHATYEMAKVIRDFAKRTRSTIKIRDTEGNFDVTTDAADTNRLSEFLSKIAERYRDRKA